MVTTGRSYIKSAQCYGIDRIWHMITAGQSILAYFARTMICVVAKFKENYTRDKTSARQLNLTRSGFAPRTCRPAGRHSNHSANRTVCFMKSIHQYEISRNVSVRGRASAAKILWTLAWQIWRISRVIIVWHTMHRSEHQTRFVQQIVFRCNLLGIDAAAMI